MQCDATSQGWMHMRRTGGMKERCLPPYGCTQECLTSDTVQQIFGVIAMSDLPMAVIVFMGGGGVRLARVQPNA